MIAYELILDKLPFLGNDIGMVRRNFEKKQKDGNYPFTNYVSMSPEA